MSLVHSAVISNNKFMLKWAVTHGSNPNLRGAHGLTPCMLAAKIGSVEVVAELIRYGATTNDVDV